jgi:hypothetical protein
MRSFRDWSIVLAEASVWQIPAGNRALVKGVRAGKATLAAPTVSHPTIGFRCVR